MVTVPRKEEMREKVDKRIDRIEQRMSELSEGPSQSVASGHKSCALDARTAALYSVLLGKFERARELFATEADHRRAGAAMRLDPDVEVSDLGQIDTTPFELVEGLYAALLSGDEDCVNAVAETTLAIEQDHPFRFRESVHRVEIDEDRYHYAKVLAALAVGMDDRIEEENRQLREVVDEEDVEGRPIHFAATARFADGFLANDRSDIEAGVGRVLERHVNTLSGGQRSSNELVCIEATGMLVLARRRGLIVTIVIVFTGGCGTSSVRRRAQPF